MKLCLASSPGGHLTEMSFLEPLFKKYDHFFVTAEGPNTASLQKREKVYLVVNSKRNPLKLVKNFFQSFRVLLKEKPDVIISTGAGVAVPTCFLGKFMGSKIIFIESFCRIENPAFSSKLVYPISDLFIVQWKRMLKYYPRSVYGALVT